MSAPNMNNSKITIKKKLRCNDFLNVLKLLYRLDSVFKEFQ